MGPVSNTGRTMMASLQQAIQKGMPPDQAIQYVKSMATQGVAPLTDLYAMVNQFERLKQKQVQPPQTPPTIKDQLNMLDQQQMQPQQMQGGIAGMQAPPPQGNPMDRGLGAIDAGRMEYPQFAGGGVVALAEGGDFDVASVYSRGKPKGASQFDQTALFQFGEKASLEELARMYALALSNNDFDTATRLEMPLRRKGMSQEYMNYIKKNTAVGLAELRKTKKQEPVNQILYGTPPAAPPAPPVDDGTQAPPPPPPPVAAAPNPFAGLGEVSGDFSKSRDFLSQLSASKKSEADITEEQQIEKLEALNKKYGIGKADEEYGKYLERREGEAGKQLAEDRRMALAQAGFAMAEAASRRGRERTGFLGAAAIGGTKGAQLIDKAVRENRALKDRLAESRMALAQSQEMRKAGNIKEGLALQRSAKKDYDATLAAIAQNEQNISQLMVEQRGMDRRTGAQIGAQRESTTAQIAAQERNTAAQIAAQEKRIDSAERIQQQRMMERLLDNAPMIIPGFEKLSVDEKAAALQSLLTGLAGGKGTMTGIIEGIEGQ